MTTKYDARARTNPISATYNSRIAGSLENGASFMPPAAVGLCFVLRTIVAP
jgi:hypothetical protein